MKPVLEVISDKEHQRSLLVFDIELQQKPAKWHYHPEIEITYVLSGEGIRQVGDHIGQFQTGDLMITGENTPHDFNMQDNNTALFLVIQFRQEILTQFSELTEVKLLLENAGRGLLFRNYDQELKQYLETALTLAPAAQLVGLA